MTMTTAYNLLGVSVLVIILHFWAKASLSKYNIEISSLPNSFHYHQEVEPPQKNELADSYSN